MCPIHANVSSLAPVIKTSKLTSVVCGSILPSCPSHPTRFLLYLVSSNLLDFICYFVSICHTHSNTHTHHQNLYLPFLVEQQLIEAATHQNGNSSKRQLIECP